MSDLPDLTHVVAANLRRCKNCGFELTNGPVVWWPVAGQTVTEINRDSPEWAFSNGDPTPDAVPCTP